MSTDLDDLIRATLAEHAEDAPAPGRVIARAPRPATNRATTRGAAFRRRWTRGLAAAGLAGALAVTGAVLVPQLLPGEATFEPAMSFAYDGTPRSAEAYRLVLDAPGWEIPEFDGAVTNGPDGGDVTYELASADGRSKPRLDVGWYAAETRDEALRFGGTFNTADANGTGDGVEELPIEVLGQEAIYWSYRGGKDVGDRDAETGQVVPTEDAYRVILPTQAGHFQSIQGTGMSKHQFETLLTQLRWVDQSGFDAALPDRYLSAEERSAAVQEMLRGVPLPESYDESRLTGLQPGRYHLALHVADGAVCIWWDEWNAATEAGDTDRKARVEEVLGAAGDWPVQQELADTDTADHLPDALQVLDEPSEGEDTFTGPELYRCV